ncbi:MAG: NAD(P)-dependent oxidoreductase [Actinomycetota bacterium]
MPTTDQTTVGFIGLGAMGEPMAANLLAAGIDVVSCANRNREPIERLAAEGLREVADPTAVGAEADVLMTVVWDEDQNDRVLRGPDGAMAAMSPGGVVLVMSTVSPTYCKELAAEATTSGITVLDCPVSGMVKGAVDGTLTLMIGGDEADVERCRPVLEPMGTVSHCGPVGTGQVMKLGNNAISIGTFGLIMEVREMVAAQGMSLDTFMEFLNRSTGRSFVSENWPMPPKRITFSGMPVKDMRRGLAAGDDVGAAMPMLARLLEAGADENEGPAS